MEHEITWEGDRKAFAAAFLAAQAEIGNVAKNAVNTAFSRNSQKPTYVDLAAVLDAVRPALADAKIALLQFPGGDGDRVAVTTTLLHESGAAVSSVLTIRPSKADAQGVGSAITYARRYALLAIVGAAPEDDDGAAASGPREAAPAKASGALLAAKSAIDKIATTAACDAWWPANKAGLEEAGDADTKAAYAYLLARKHALKAEAHDPETGEIPPRSQPNGAHHATA